MKTLIKAALAATVATGLFASPALAADTKPFTAKARIVSPLTLTLTNGGLDFGTITMLPTLVSSKVVVGRAGTGGGTNDCEAGLNCTTPAPAKFSVAGSVGQPLTITTSALTALTSGSNTVPFAINAPSSVTLKGPGLGQGTEVFEIGGTITIASGTADGTYTGDVNVTVEYS